MPLPRLAGECGGYRTNIWIIRWLGEVELTFDPLSTLPLSVYPWREAPTMPQSGWRLWRIGQIYGWWLGEVELTFDPLSTLPLSVYPWREAPTMPQSGWRLWRI